MLSPLHAGERGLSSPPGQRKTHQNGSLRFCLFFSRPYFTPLHPNSLCPASPKTLYARSLSLYHSSKGQLRHQDFRESSRTIDQPYEFRGILKGMATSSKFCPTGFPQFLKVLENP
ncbi:hypothetical protein AVEN_192137-1 [Araneus ventricosus]|uniref:Uncharacterized protein n=1 Tax=Araneus ventricosus TaxID=182803 RepID=A0A4Y2QS96_ARAVE|nr:hypothetical protein AVEN_192137-1 [Araneus ventricosus]